MFTRALVHARRRALVAGLVLATTLVPALARPRAADAATPMAAYHDQTGAQHQAHWSRLAGSGYRPVSISVYGTATDRRYAAVWLQRTGPAFSGFHGLTFSEFTNWNAARVAEGYHPTMVAATGAGSSVTLAGVYEKGSGNSALANLTQAAFDERNAKEFNGGRRLKWAAIYGTASAPLYAGVWGPQPSGVPVRWWAGPSPNATDFSSQYNAQVQNYVRPALVTMAADQRYLGLWQDDLLPGFQLFTDLTADAYQTKFNELTAAGQYPLFVQGAGAGATRRFSAMFGSTDARVPRTWATPTGPAVAGMAGFDTYMRSLMTSAGARAGQLAVVRNGKLAYTRGYTLAEAGYGQTTPTNVFRIASCSKPITSVLTHKAIESSRLTYDTTMQSKLRLTTPSGGIPPDVDFHNITVDQLLVHTAGFNSNPQVATNPPAHDALFNDPMVAAAFGKSVPVTKTEAARWGASQYVPFKPGTTPSYSNFGYGLLGMTAAVAFGYPPETPYYEQAVLNRVFGPLNVTRARVGWSDFSRPLGGEVRYHSLVPWLSRSVTAAARPWVQVQYGYNNRNLDAAGGWVLSAPDYAKLLASFDMRDKNPVLTPETVARMWSTPAGMNLPSGAYRGWYAGSALSASGTKWQTVHHNGSIAGSSCLVWRRADGLSFVLLLNTDIPGLLDGNRHGNQLNDIANKVTSWPTQDLFPQVGIRSFFE